MNDLSVSDWQLIGLTVDQLGPFQHRQQFSFLGDTPSAEAPDEPPGPSNLYMLLAANGRGKTTLLETIHGLFGLLARPGTGRFAVPGAQGQAQLDVRATWTIDGATRTVLLSIWTGASSPLSTWPKDRLEEEGQATEWARLGIFASPNGLAFSDESNDLGAAFHRAITARAGSAPGSLFGETINLPTVLFFPADRMLLVPPGRRIIEAPDNWVYQPAHCFGVDGAEWNGSIENLLAWLLWVGEKEQERLLRFINERMYPDQDKVILPIERAELQTYVRTGEGSHLLSALSHGERALLQLFLRTAAHMSRNTIILIDEVETHLHTRWMNRMYQALKDLLRAIPSLTIVFTTHNRELIQVFDHTRPEPGIVKGGYLLADDMS